jgi:hypothetical protein
MIYKLISIAEWSEASTVFGRSNVEIFFFFFLIIPYAFFRRRIFFFLLMDPLDIW